MITILSLDFWYFLSPVSGNTYIGGSRKRPAIGRTEKTIQMGLVKILLFQVNHRFSVAPACLYPRWSKRATTCNRSAAVRPSASKLLFQASVTVRSDRPVIRKSFIRGRLPQVMLKAEGVLSVRSLKAWIFRFRKRL